MLLYAIGLSLCATHASSAPLHSTLQGACGIRQRGPTPRSRGSAWGLVWLLCFRDGSGVVAGSISRQCNRCYMRVVCASYKCTLLQKEGTLARLTEITGLAAPIYPQHRAVLDAESPIV